MADAGGAAPTTAAAAAAAAAAAHTPFPWEGVWPKITDPGAYDNGTNFTNAQRSEGGKTSAGKKTHKELQETGLQNVVKKKGIYADDSDGKSNHLAHSADGGAGNGGKPKTCE
jgi:hypothetical protein